MQCCGWERNHTKGRKLKRTIPTETITWPRFTGTRQGRKFNRAFPQLNYCLCGRGTALLLLPSLFWPCFLLYETPQAMSIGNQGRGCHGEGLQRVNARVGGG